MRKRILLTLAIFGLIGASLFAQTIEGGAGIIHVDGDPNLNAALVDVTINEGNIAYDKDTQVAYFFDPAGTAYDAVGAPAIPGTQWIAVDVSALVDPITSILTPETELTTTIVNGVATITFESDATIAFDPSNSELTFTDVDGDPTTIDISGGTVIEALNPSVTIAGAGTVATPYTIELTGSDVDTNDGFVPVTDGNGNLSWEKVVKSAAFLPTGELELTFTDDTKALVNMESIPTVANITELTAAAAAVDGTSGGVARAAATNTLGMPATADMGVLFFISN